MLTIKGFRMEAFCMSGRVSLHYEIFWLVQGERSSKISYFKIDCRGIRLGAILKTLLLWRSN